MAEEPAAQLHSSGPTLTSIFPMFSPRSRPRKALRRVLDALDDVSRYRSRPSRTHSGGLACELAEAVVVVADDVALDAEPLRDDHEHVPRPRRRLGVVVAGDRAAGDDPAVRPQRADRRLEVVAADVVEVDVDAVGRELGESRVARRCSR